MPHHRRHLTSGQLSVVALDVEALLAEEAKERQGKRTDLEENIDICQKVGTSKKPQRADEQAASLVGTNKTYISAAKKLQAEAPDLLDDVRTIPLARSSRWSSAPSRRSVLVEDPAEAHEMDERHQAGWLDLAGASSS